MVGQCLDPGCPFQHPHFATNPVSPEEFFKKMESYKEVSPEVQEKL